jgi:hypothetical protein
MKLKSFGGLTQQIFEKSFKDMLFTIYNFAEEERYVYNLSKMGYDSDIDSLEFTILDKVNDVNLKEFKYYIENELQNEKVIVGVLLIDSKKGKLPVIIKPKNVDVFSVFNH